jgi:hypothetical protein
MQNEFIQFCITEAQLDLSKEKRNGLSGYPESPFHYNEVETILLIISPLLL